ncbi:MAG: NAD(P)-dependent oxidoreductase, partial [Chloroflexota bacterium]
MGLNDDLRELEAEGTPIQMGLVGAGQMGRGLISQVEMMRGMRVVAVADLFVDRVVEAYRHAGVPDDNIVVAEDITTASEAVATGKRVATTLASLLPAIEDVEAIVDASGVPEVGATVALNTILHRKHVVMLTVETDVTVGYMLRSMAEAAGVVYTVSAGDEPGAIKELYDFADALGFEIVAAGKGKNNPLNRKATPDTLAAEAAAKEMNAKMLVSFVDGTKTMVEMTAVANATGLVPEVRGMHGPTTTVADLPKVFSLREQGGILQRSGVVDYALGV